MASVPYKRPFEGPRGFYTFGASRNRRGFRALGLQGFRALGF